MRLALAGMVVVLSAGAAAAQTMPPADPLAVRPIPAHAGETAVIRTKVEQAGYTEVADLARDSTGVWRGTAKKGDDAVDILVDKGGRVKATRR
ncbi:MAG: hypothetical protein Q8M19_27595 [Reyranella sp.]|nr:hypothetical protein [Reyranella sp.]